MGLEIERKFLVLNDSWKPLAISRHEFRDGLIGRFDAGKVRVRVDGSRAWITIKGQRKGIARAEFEYPIPREDAEEILETICSGRLICKTRFCVPFEGFHWMVDVHEGELAGVTFAEVELQHEQQRPALPPWVGKEVTGDPQYRKTSLLERALAGRFRAT